MPEHFQQQSLNSPRQCPRCGSLERLYRTPRGLRCADCVKTMDSSGLSFR
ncbi:MAG: hypothetical protein LYZ70_05135 [Nitrososphaerales archaeon]|nr:hypothetical protein [Nitrososphaerales archaeon]